MQLNKETKPIKYHFWVFGMTWPGIEPHSPGPLANILTIMPIDKYCKNKEKQCKHKLWEEKLKYSNTNKQSRKKKTKKITHFVLAPVTKSFVHH